jgi:hypothetical protein
MLTVSSADATSAGKMATAVKIVAAIHAASRQVFKLVQNLDICFILATYVANISSWAAGGLLGSAAFQAVSSVGPTRSYKLNCV